MIVQGEEIEPRAVPREIAGIGRRVRAVALHHRQAHQVGVGREDRMDVQVTEEDLPPGGLARRRGGRGGGLLLHIRGGITLRGRDIAGLVRSPQPTLRTAVEHQHHRGEGEQHGSDGALDHGTLRDQEGAGRTLCDAREARIVAARLSAASHCDAGARAVRPVSRRRPAPGLRHSPRRGRAGRAPHRRCGRAAPG